MKPLKQLSILIPLLTFSIPSVYAEGQGGMGEFFVILYSISFFAYTLFIACAFLFTRKLLAKKNSKKEIWIAFGIGFLFALTLLVICDHNYIPLFWVM